jgi:uncharacterized iron-regulated protein
MALVLADAMLLPIFSSAKATNLVAVCAYPTKAKLLFLPVNWLVTALWAALLCACASPPPVTATDIAAELQALRGAHAILLGEQHDNPDHQRIEREVVEALAANGRLGALVLEMAERGNSTQGLSAAATPDEVKAALRWDERAWPWARYAPAIMAAVRGGAPVLGANLPRAQMRAAMGDAALDTRLDAAALQTQQDAIRDGHCDALPASQIAPMARIQIARDLAMADTLARAADQAAPMGMVAVLLAGSGHVDKSLGVPRHLRLEVLSKSVLLGAGIAQSATEKIANFDHVWTAKDIPGKDYCADLKAPGPG